MDALDNKAPRQIPDLPRMILGGITLLPVVSADGCVMVGSWLKPGGGVLTTTEAEQIAANRGANLVIIYKDESK